MVLVLSSNFVRIVRKGTLLFYFINSETLIGCIRCRVHRNMLCEKLTEITIRIWTVWTISINPKSISANSHLPHEKIPRKFPFLDVFSREEVDSIQLRIYSCETFYCSVLYSYHFTSWSHCIFIYNLYTPIKWMRDSKTLRTHNMYRTYIVHIQHSNSRIQYLSVGCTAVAAGMNLFRKRNCFLDNSLYQHYFYFQIC